MKERKLDFQKYDNPALVEDVNGTLSSKLQEGCEKINRNLGMLHELLAKGKLDEGMKKALLTSAEHEFTALLSDLGYAGVLAEEKEKRYAQIRSLNIENRELRAQLGEKVSLEDIREKLKNIEQNFDAWWSEYGFGHSDAIQFGGYSAKITLSGMVFGSRGINRMSEADKDTYLTEMGFEIDDRRVVANDKSISLLNDLLISKMPSCEIRDIKTTSNANGVFVFSEIVIYIGDYNDFNL